MCTTTGGSDPYGMASCAKIACTRDGALLVACWLGWSWAVWIGMGVRQPRPSRLLIAAALCRWVYYVAIVADLFLRFLWTLTYIPHAENNPFGPNLNPNMFSL